MNNKLNKIQLRKLSAFFSFDNYFAPTKVIVATKKLSDFYSSMSTRLAGCLYEAPFILITNKQNIVAAGFSKLCKAIITVDVTNESVIELMQKQLSERLAHIECAKKREDAKVNEDAAILAEANSILVDDQFRCDLIIASRNYTGIEKSNMQSQAFVALLSRNGVEKINTDFWKVFSIIKNK